MTMPRQRGLTEQAADAAIDSACRLLRLPSIRNEFSDIADRATKDEMSYRGFLAELLMAECGDRARHRSERRIKAAGFPREKSLRSFDFDANPNIGPATIHTLASCEWIKKSQPLCLIGDSGTGKSHMLIALGTEAAMKGYRVRYTLATKLVNELVEAARIPRPGRPLWQGTREWTRSLGHSSEADMTVHMKCAARRVTVRAKGPLGPSAWSAGSAWRGSPAPQVVADGAGEYARSARTTSGRVRGLTGSLPGG
ncbi:ATP-binding protein [Streptomyces sp. NPDC050164]|uniref:ATP-binding protein n=1 Tax=Streptomyces sp. NPDC050164 TaxID=3365605 RepID=UPI003797204C